MEALENPLLLDRCLLLQKVKGDVSISPRGEPMKGFITRFPVLFGDERLSKEGESAENKMGFGKERSPFGKTQEFLPLLEAEGYIGGKAIFPS